MNAFSFCDWTIQSDFSEAKFFTSGNELLVQNSEDRETIFSASFEEDYLKILDHNTYLFETKIFYKEKVVDISRIQLSDEMIVEGEF